MTTVSANDVKDLQNKGQKILIQVTASWCGPCKSLTPRLEQLEEDYENITFLKVDVDENPDYAADLEIRSVPTVLMYSGEELKDRSTGVQSDRYYKEALNSL